MFSKVVIMKWGAIALAVLGHRVSTKRSLWVAIWSGRSPN